MNGIHRAIPARRLPPELLAATREHLEPIDYTLLRQAPPADYRVGPRDVLGIHIEEVLGKEDELPAVAFPFSESEVKSPAVGTPVKVEADGTIALPYIPPLPVAGLTTPQIVERLRKAYAVERDILKRGQDRILVTVMKPRSYHVLVVREDTGGDTPTIKPKDATVLSRRGSAQVFDLPAYENDVLHALSLSGGLPGQDARNEVWVLRGAGAHQWQTVVDGWSRGESPSRLVQSVPRRLGAVRIPLRVAPGEPPGFDEADVMLYDGDVVFVESRETEYFLSGGLLPGGRFPLPRDRDMDVIEAIATAGGAAGGPPGTGTQIYQFRGGSGPGNIVPPTRVIVLRTVPGRGQIKIHVNLRRALDHAKERIIIQPGDVVTLQYTPAEIAANIALNTVNVTFAIPNR